MSEFNYKVGDRVRIKDIGWYNENKNEDGDVELSTAVFLPEMSKYCGTIVTIKDIFYDNNDIVLYQMEGGIIWGWTDEMIECLVERNGKTYPYKIGDRVVLKGNNRCATITDLKYNSWGNLSYYVKIDNDKNISIDYPTDLLLPYDNMFEGGLMEEETKSKYEDEKNGEAKPKYEDEVNGEYYSTPKYLVRPSGYQFVDENGNVINATKIVLEKKTVEEKYNDVKIQILGNVVILKGGINTDNPTEYMNEVVDYILKLLGKPKYNQFIEDYLDNPWVRILVFDFNSMEFKNSFNDIVTNFKQQ